MSYRFPPEIWDHVIDHLWSSPNTLKACSLTCKAWYPSARMHLFRTIKLSPAIAHKDLQVVRHIAHLTRELIIAACSIDLPQLDDRYLPMFEAMVNVDKLIFQRLSADWESVDSHKFRTRLARLPPAFVRSIKSLTLDYVIVPHLVYITDLLAFFRHVSEVHISWVFLVDKTGVNIPVTQLTFPSEPMNVTEVSCNRFDAIYTSKLLTWVGKASNMRYPRTLKLIVNNFGHIHLREEQTLYSTIFREVGPNLEHLWLTRNHWEDDSSGKSSLPLYDG